MAIMTPLGGTGGISDATINTMLQSGDRDLINKANEYVAQREKEIKEREADKGILGIVADLFGFSKLAAAEPNFNTGQNYSNRFSVTSPPQFETKPEVIVPGNIDMAESVFANYPYLKENTETTGINKVLTPEQQLQLYLQSEGGDVDIEDVNRFAPQGIFSRAKDFAQRKDVRTGLGFLLGGVPGGILSFFAPKIGEGITGLINRFRPAPNIPVRNIGDTDMSRNVTTGTGQSVSDSDLSSIGDTGFSEYSSPGVAAEYEGSF